MALRERFIYAIDMATDGVETGFNRISKEIKGTEGGINKLKAGWKGAVAEFKNSRAAQAAAFAAVAVVAKKAIADASDLEESINAVTVTYGEAAEGVLAIGENSAKSFGLSSSEFNSMAVQFSSFVEQVAGPGGDVVETLNELTTRAADFASVMNLDVADAARVFQSGLAGETEPLKKFGINLSAASVQAFALETGLIASKSEMTEAMKVTARYGLLMQETSDTQGDFENTSDSLANQQRILTSTMTNLSAELGSVLIPQLSELVGVIQDVVDTAESLGVTLENRDSWQELTKNTTQGEISVRGLKDGLGDLRTVLGWVGVGSESTADKLSRLGDGASDLDRAIADATRTTEDATEATEDLGDQSKIGAGHIQQLERSIGRKAREDEQAAAAADEHREALEDLIDAVDSANSSMFDYESATLEMVAAEISLRGQTEATNLVLNDSEASVDDKTQAMVDLRNAEIDTAEAALATSEAFAAEAGASKGSEEFARLQKEELGRLQDQFPGLREEIQGYIDELDRIPSVKSTNITAYYRSVGSSSVPVSGINGPRAQGGPTFAGLHQVIEDGPELLEQDGKTFLMSEGGGNVVPLNGSGQSGTGSGLGGVTVSFAGANFYGSPPDRWAAELAEQIDKVRRGQL